MEVHLDVSMAEGRVRIREDESIRPIIWLYGRVCARVRGKREMVSAKPRAFATSWARTSPAALAMTYSVIPFGLLFRYAVDG